MILNNVDVKVNDNIVSAHALAMIIETECNYVSSNGSDAQQQFLMINSDYSAMANKNDIYQRRSDNHCLQIGMEEFDEDLVMSRSRRVGEQALELLDAEDCPTETMSLVLASDQMLLQIHESIGHALEVDRILGAERNYAGWSFVREKDFGKLQYGSNIMNITFDPTVEHQFASYGFDDGGLKAEREYIIKVNNQDSHFMLFRQYLVLNILTISIRIVASLNLIQTNFNKVIAKK